MIQPILQMANNASGRSGDQPIPGLQILTNMPRPPLQISAGAELARRLAEKSRPDGGKSRLAIADGTRPDGDNSRPDGGMSRPASLDRPAIADAPLEKRDDDTLPKSQLEAAPVPRPEDAPLQKLDDAPGNSIIDKIRAARELQQAARAKACMRRASRN